MTVKSKKRRLKRAREHQALSKTKAKFYGRLEIAGRGEPVVLAAQTTDSFKNFTPLSMTQVAESDRISREADVAFPSRSKCPQCGFSQKVRKDGTMSRHDVYAGSTPSECVGTGKQWNSG